ncbi:MAG TPA: hypothetical protein VH063_00095 [Gaiellaceae bacterium]|jgi:hypothetical protein|nr:hypothetical protein [Gaiellaceae bacterium]
MRVWITDGSLPVFSDTIRLNASHKALFGIPTRYEGFVDPAVERGSATIAAEREDDALVVEAEWALEFPDGIPAEVDPSTPVVVQGLAEGKWLNRLLGTREWQPASLGNNMLAEGPGIRSSLGALELGRPGTVRLSYERADGGIQEHSSPLEAIRGNHMLGLVREVLRVASENGGIDAIDLGALGELAAVVNEPARIKASARPLPIPHRAKERLVRKAIADRVSVPPGATVSLQVLNGAGAVVGEGALRLAG